MFEKEAKERARKIEENQTLGVYDSDEDYARDRGWNEGEVAGYEEGFKDGAEFGYNKATRDVKRIIGNLIYVLTILGVADLNAVKEAKQYLKEAEK